LLHHRGLAIELSIRRVHLAGITPNPNTAWMMQIGPNLTAPDGVLAGKRFIIMDRDGKFCDAFRTMLSECGTEPLRLPPRRMSAKCGAKFNAVHDSVAFSATTSVIRHVRFSPKTARRVLKF